jgi:phage gp29-like protein
LEEIGATGTQIFGGLLGQQDYNPDLNSSTAYDQYDKMRNDGQVRAALMAIKLPLLNADWTVEAPTDAPSDREIAERLQDNLTRGMSLSWQDFLRQALLMLDYGSMPFEKVWEIQDGLVVLRKLAPRLPKTVLAWNVDETGGLAGIQQGTYKASGYSMVDIPVDKLLVFVNDLEGSNWRGCSVLRPAWKHYWYKDGLYRVQSIALEKRSLGVDVGTLKGEGISEERKQEAERALMTLHAHEKQFVTEIDGQFSYRMEGVGRGSLLDPMGAIEHHDLRILRSILAEFLAMGAGSTGSLAMHKDKSAFFLMSLGAIASNIADTVSTHLLRQWVDFNWDVAEYPRLRYSRLEQRDVATFSEAVATLIGSGSLTKGPEVESEARSLLNLPQRINENPEPPVPLLTAPENLAAYGRQVDKLVEVGGNLFGRHDPALVAAVAVPFRSRLVAELKEEGRESGSAEAEATVSGLRLKARFVEAMIGQFEGETFDAAKLREALD